MPDDKQQSVHISYYYYCRLLWHFERKDVMSGKIDEEEGHVRAYLVYAILMSIVAVVTLLVVLVMRRRIALVSQLFKETGKAIYSMPGLLLQPIYVCKFLYYFFHTSSARAVCVLYRIKIISWWKNF